jgi:hypothetical protein
MATRSAADLVSLSSYFYSLGFWRIIASPELMKIASLRKAVWCR